MKVIVNGQTRNFDGGLTLSELLVKEKVETPQYVSIQLNGEFTSDISLILKNNDEVEFVYFMGGGA